MKYIFDTNIFIQLWHEISPKTFVSFWKDVANAIHSGKILLHRQVYEEISKINDDLKKYIGQFSAERIEISEGQQEIIADIVNRFEYWEDQIKQGDADLFVIATAKESGCTIISSDKHVRGFAKKYSLRCIRKREFFTEIGWTY